jgi:sugar/nucleoside kinase (ribokinase family)
VKDGTRDLVPLVDLLVASSRFPALFTGADDRLEALGRLRALGPRFVAMTLGREGAIALAPDGSVVRSAGFAVEAIDTTGAGDAFHGAFVYGLLQGWTVARTLDFSNAAAALNCTAAGARGRLGSLAEVEAFAARTPRA